MFRRNHGDLMMGFSRTPMCLQALFIGTSIDWDVNLTGNHIDLCLMISIHGLWYNSSFLGYRNIHQSKCTRTTGLEVCRSEVYKSYSRIFPFSASRKALHDLLHGVHVTSEYRTLCCTIWIWHLVILRDFLYF